MEKHIRYLAITDIETTGLNPDIHEIIEIGLLVVKPKIFTIKDALNIKIKPKQIHTADKKALEVNGYNPLEWKNAISLEEAMLLYREKTEDSIFCAYNVIFDWSFIEKAFNITRIKNLMHYHRLDILSMAWLKLGPHITGGLSLNNVAKLVGIPEETKPHRAINGALTAYMVLKKLTANKVN